MIRATLAYLAHRLRGHDARMSRWVVSCNCGLVRQRRDPLTDPVWREGR